MQLIPRYLVNDEIFIISNDAGFTVEYRPVYSRQTKVYRGIDNTLQFRMLNADQKPVEVFGKTVVFVMFDENQTKILERNCTITDDGTTLSTKGMFAITISENDLLNIKQQYLTYNIYTEQNSSRKVTYANRNFDSTGVIYVDGNAFPGPIPSTEITNFYPLNDYWVAGSDDADKITAYPGLNGNEALHTVAIYSNEYVGDIEIQVTLDNQITGLNNWSTINTLTFDGTETEPVPVNFNGIVSFIRFKLDSDPTDKITKILVRN